MTVLSFCSNNNNNKNGSENFLTSEGLSLYYQWQRVNNPRAILLIVHGVGEHIGRYQSFENWFAERGFTCYGYDQRGHGRSGGRRSHVEGFSQYVDDLQFILTDVQNREPGLPVFIFSHSMGTIISLSHALVYPSVLKGIIISSCAIELGSSMPTWFLKLIYPISKMLPGLRVPSMINVANLTHDKEILDRYKHDALMQNTLTLKWLISFYEAQQNIIKLAYKITVPMLVLHSSGDRVTSVNGIRKLLKLIGSNDKSYVEYDFMYHELHNEVVEKREVYMEKIAGWCDEKLAG